VRCMLLANCSSHASQHIYLCGPIRLFPDFQLALVSRHARGMFLFQPAIFQDFKSVNDSRIAGQPGLRHSADAEYRVQEPASVSIGVVQNCHSNTMVQPAKARTSADPLWTRAITRERDSSRCRPRRFTSSSSPTSWGGTTQERPREPAAQDLRLPPSWMRTSSLPSIRESDIHQYSSWAGAWTQCRPSSTGASRLTRRGPRTSTSTSPAVGNWWPCSRLVTTRSVPWHSPVSPGH
jgi:hypothetical protein